MPAAIRMEKTTVACLIWAGLLALIVRAQTPCNILDPRCRSLLNRQRRIDRPNIFKPLKKCSYPDLYLIPNKADDSCTRPESFDKQVVRIDPSSVKIRPEVIRLPGCFVVEFRNVEILSSSRRFPQGFLGKAEYQWWNLKKFSQLKCQNTSSDGCGGFGNNCFYCDLCNSLEKLNEAASTPNRNNTEQLLRQFRGLHCPDKAGVYTFRKQFCFNDWSVFDKDGDCQLDFWNSDDGKLTDYKDALKSIQQLGYGTMVAKFKLAHNATAEQLSRRRAKERQIASVVDEELRPRRRSWHVSHGRFDSFRDWYIRYRQDAWHKTKYLPWLIWANEVACVKVTFDVCDKRPRKRSLPPNRFRTYRGPSWQCI